MKSTISILFLYVQLLLCKTLTAQNSVLLSLGTDDCNSLTNPKFYTVKNPTSTSPQMLSNCGLSPITPDPFNVFVAYNPKSNQSYIADVRSGTDTKIWIVDIGLPNNINCSGNLAATPTYSYTFSSNNFEFDNDGNLWSLDGINVANGQSILDKIDVNTGNIINTRILQFPLDQIPFIIESGDLCILPNGRMFAVLGGINTKLYEITNYTGTSTAVATFLKDLPKDCFGIAYINGSLQITGFSSTPGASCFYNEYNIGTGVLSAEKTFPLGKLPSDNSSFTANLGITKRLFSARMINTNTYDITYEIYAENLGNVRLNNVNISDDLGQVFGAANVSNVQTSFAAGGNPAGLTLNTLYNGTTVKNVFNNNQQLFNKNNTNTNYFTKVQIKCRVTNLVQATTYLNSAVATAEIGSAASGNIINVTDSSNNGNATVIDPNQNGNANETGENIPTPFTLNTLPVKFISISAMLQDANNGIIKWAVATPTINAKIFEIEYSNNGVDFSVLGSINITNAQQSSYSFNHINIPNGINFYRIKQTDDDGIFVYSTIVRLQKSKGNIMSTIFPNPSNEGFYLSMQSLGNNQSYCNLFEASGKLIERKQLLATQTYFSTMQYANGIYFLMVQQGNEQIIHRIKIAHQ